MRGKLCHASLLQFDGSDSGARPDEAVSWGKIRLNSKGVKVRDVQRRLLAARDLRPRCTEKPHCPFRSSSQRRLRSTTTSRQLQQPLAVVLQLLASS